MTDARLRGEEVPTGARGWWKKHGGGSAAGSALFVGVWAALDATVNSRFPAPDSLWRALLPSVDVTVLGVILGLCAWRGRRMPVAGMGVAVTMLVLVRLFRVGDGVGLRYFNRPLNLYLDLRLLPELVRLLGSTVSRWILVLGASAAVLILFGVGLLGWWALRYAEHYLAAPAHRRAAAAVVVGLSFLGPVGGGDGGGSVAPRLWREGAFAVHRREYRQRLLEAMDTSQRRLTDAPHDLAALQGADLFVFLIESYGATVNATPVHRSLMAPIYAAFEAKLEAHGFSIVTGALDSPTYAGRSWLAQATLTTGVRTEDSIGFGLLQQRRPKALPGFLKDAGYRTIFVQPGTTTPWPARWSYGVDRTYSAWELDYQGPTFRWASMPDQYVIDFVHRREVAPPHGPLFAAYALVSSHAPWSDQPQVVADWNALDHGRIYRQLPVFHYPMHWLNLEEAGPAYISSIGYDLAVLQRYIVEEIPRDALVIVLGDHQPVGDVTEHDPSSAVPVHVISRNPRFTERFRRLGYVPGMRPDPSRRAAGMETFLPDFLRAFSTPADDAAPSSLLVPAAAVGVSQ